jgi:hypothetical protein
VWTVFKESLDKSARPVSSTCGSTRNASLLKQDTEPAAMACGDLALASVAAFDLARSQVLLATTVFLQIVLWLPQTMGYVAR